MSGIRKDILWRVYLVYFSICLCAIAIIVQIVKIQTTEREHWLQKAEELTIRYVNIDAARGNIYAADGSLLATSLPIYEVRMDPNTESLSDELFYNNIDSLAMSLAGLFRDKSARTWKTELIKARKNGQRYLLIRRNVRYTELKAMKSFPIFRMGRYKGGLIYTQKNRRVKPFRLLAARTIGYDRPGVQPVGLEGAYAKHLEGTSGKRLMKKIAGNAMMPVNDKNEIEPEDGYDIITTIDVNIQDVAEHALLTQLQQHDADHGCVVLMEVKTGKVKAIANLSRNDKGQYYEYYNYAIGESTEPGSTFKLPALMAALEDGLVKLSDSVDTEDGTTKYYDRTMKDSHRGGYGKISVKRAFEVSSNVGISRIIHRSYVKRPQQFADRLYEMGLHKKLGIEIAGEGEPYVKDTRDKSWSGTTLPWMSIGYEVSLTPLQILTFYNAVANNGKMVKPLFVESVRKLGNTVEAFEPVVINESICSEETIKAAREMLEGVVENGTATNLGNLVYKIAGKTGTAQIANKKYGYKYQSAISYQASFVGYFPADDPKYSCIVVVNAPSGNVYYGNQVAGPIFREIADKIYAGSLQIHEEVNHSPLTFKPAPYVKKGIQSEVLTACREMNIPVNTKAHDAQWVSGTTEDSVTVLQSRNIDRELKQGLMPDLKGMGIMDALYLLENQGILVDFTGSGRIVRQSVAPGARIHKGNKVILELS